MATASDPQTRWAEAHSLREDGRIDAASAIVVALWENHRADRAATLATLGFLKECGVHDRALPIARDARERWPHDAHAAAWLGEIALALGRFEEAAEALRAAIGADPAQAASWLRLAYCRRFDDADDEDLQRFRDGWASANLDAATLTCIGFALGKALDDLDDAEQAADILIDANALAHKASAWRGRDWQRLVDDQLRRAALPSLATDETFAPIFVVGLPRSGTTLIANALARHAEVRDRGELNWIPALHALLQEQGQLYNPPSLRVIAAMIRAQMRRDDAPARFYLDKNPLNFRHLDFIAACFPNAKIVHCRRGARDTALSIWMQHFAHEDLGFAYDFSSIAQVQRDCARLMAHWRARLSLPILDVDYEDFVADPPRQRRCLAEFLGLPATDAGESTDDKPRIVTTASVWQVRQPVYTRAVERWRRYAPYLRELAELFPEQ